MLILTRRCGEKILINDGEIIITVLGVKGSQARLGIEAPANVSVHREEIQNKIDEEKLEMDQFVQVGEERLAALMSTSDPNIIPAAMRND